MKRYLADLAQRVGTVFVLSLAGSVTLDNPFNVTTFQWDVALTQAGSLATLALLTGLAARMSRDKNSAGF